MVIVTSSWRRALVASLNAAIPARLAEAWRGPARVLSIGRETSRIVRHAAWFRPVDVVVSSDLVLRHQLPLPRLQQRDLVEAVKLFIRSETPFSPDELLISVTPGDDAAAAGDETPYDLLMVSRSAIEQGLKARRIANGMVRAIFVGDPGRAQPTELARGLTPLGRFAGWKGVLPAAVIAVALIVVGFQQIGAANARVQGLTGEVMTLTDDVAKLGQERTRRAAAVEAEAATISISDLLASIQRERRPDTDIVAILVDSGLARVTVRAANPLADVTSFAEALPDWSVTVGGIITKEADGRQGATLLFQRKL